MYVTRYAIPGVLVSSILALFLLGLRLMSLATFLKSVVLITVVLWPLACLSLLVCLCVRVLVRLQWVRSRDLWVGYRWLASEVTFLALSGTVAGFSLLVGIFVVG